MTAFAGQLIAGALYAASAASVGMSTDLDTRTYPTFPQGGYAGSSTLTGSKTDTQPITEPALNKSGQALGAFAADYYDRIHYSDLAFDLGNVITNTERTVSVWNAYAVAKTLQSVSATGNEGITLTQPVTPPITWPARSEQTYQIIVTTDGPPIIDASYTWLWTAANGATVSIVGSRITAWVWRPNWARGITERLSWLTDVIRGYDGTEQRIRARKTPRRTFEFEYLVAGAQRRKFEAALWDWHARVWSLPTWTDGQQLTAPLTAGGFTITATTTDLDYHVGGFAMLLDPDSGAHEVAEIAALAAGEITTVRPLVSSWPADTTWIYPARSARLQAQHKVARWTGDHAGSVAVFEATDSSAWPAATESETYRSIPVFSAAHNSRTESSDAISRALNVIDNGVGKWSVDDTTGHPDSVVNHLWSATTRAEITALRSWLYSRQGRLTHFWRPTGRRDLVLMAPVSDVATNIDIEGIGYTKYYSADTNRRDIRIETTGGAVYMRRITGTVEVDASTERLTIDAPLGVSLAVADIARISFMELRRLDSDTLELAWWTGEVADCSMPMRSISNDV